MPEKVSCTFDIAKVWRGRGWGLIPIQPNTKKIVKGFGQYQKRVETDQEINYWFRDRNCNLAVVCPITGVVLDFDRIEIYNEFCGVSPHLAKSYTEYTPRWGRHVFLIGTSIIKPGLKFVPGIEVKRFCLVFPSIVDGRGYGISNPGLILRGDILKGVSMFLLTKQKDSLGGWGERASDKLEVVLREKSDKRGILTEVKSQWSILNYLHFFEPRLVLKGQGRFLAGCCPWHDDETPSLWVDWENNIWGCHGCGRHGDVINWHALKIHTSDMVAAARDLARCEIRFITDGGNK